MNDKLKLSNVMETICLINSVLFSTPLGILYSYRVLHYHTCGEKESGILLTHRKDKPRAPTQAV